MEQIRGYVSQIIFRNNDNSYTVFEVNADGDCFTCFGYLPSVSEGESCQVEGEFIEHRVYGEQLRVERYQAVEPQDREAMLRYLSSGAIKGIRETLAARIVKTFGDETMRVLDEEPMRLAEIKGISERMAREIAAQVTEKRDVRDALLFLQKYGISNRQAMKIWNTYGMDMYEILRENPYRLAEDITGIGFARADEIASRIGIQPDSDYRIRSGILFILSQALQEGSSYLPKDTVLLRSSELLGIPEEAVEIQLGNLQIERRAVIRVLGEEVQVYDESAYRQEQQIARMLTDLNAAPVHEYTDEEITARIRRIQEHEQIELDELQLEAVETAARKPILILSGGPGTGKTTTINTIIRYFISDTKAVVLAAPTGRAAKRMSEATGYEAMTIHRLLECKTTGEEDTAASGQGFYFERGKDNPLEANVIIIDEMSMVDIFLMGALLRAVSPGTRLIFVGDVDQLPSVGPGRVLQDMMESGVFPTVILHKIFRQAQESDIVMNAHRILEGKMLVLDNHSKDFFFLERKDAAVIYKHTVQLMLEKLPGYLKCDPLDIQVLTPMKKGALGAIRLNEVLQSVLNPPAAGRKEYTAHETTFRVGDKVMQTRNNYQMPWEVPGNFGMALDKGTGIFNGDFGVILEISDALQEMTVRFDENRVVHYPFAELDDLELAYAITVHKSQGSEYPAVILPLLTGPTALFNRNLLYTAVTRAKGTVMILGSRSALETMISSRSRMVRYTGLRHRICAFAGTEESR